MSISTSESNISSVLFLSENNRGRLQLIINTNLDDNSKFGIIDNVFVDPKHRKQGIATSLIEEAIQYAKKHDLYKIILNCSSENIDLYHKCNFKVYQYNMRYLLK